MVYKRTFNILNDKMSKKHARFNYQKMKIYLIRKYFEKAKSKP